MSAVSELYNVPEGFRTVVRTLLGAATHPDVHLTRIAPPEGLAPYAVSLAAEVGRFPRVRAKAAARRREPVLAPTTGRFVLLHDPSAPRPWDGTFRIVTWLRTQVDPQMGGDEFMLDVAWSWLTGALSNLGAEYSNEAGTVSRIQDKTFGSLKSQADSSMEIEVRASWTPLIPAMDVTWADTHVRAWADALGTASGLPPHIEGVTFL